LYLFANASDYRRQRIETFVTGKCQEGVDLLGDCFQLNQSWIAISSGGLTGLGPGTSRARWGMLPNAYTDFIVSITGEEYGFIGILILTIIFLILIISFYGMAVTTDNSFKKLILVGLGTWVGLQTIINLGGAVGLLPITGIVLPFISYGGTAMVSIFIGLSLAHNETLYNE
ncbi:MAG: FtsW/RodA/SpoVE family cell cycle protein, partial [Actinobacteria bacterium]|nr:FtsW/RodA/SpoVE family cell cycle protein [Actinomycetota bacterium]